MADAEFVLDPRLADDTLPVGRLGLCDVRLMNDRRYPWVILVPMVPDLVELHQLPATLSDALHTAIIGAGRAVAAWPGVDKINTGALGNVVAQLHVHVVGRRAGDPAWPGPVWGHSPRVPYEHGVEAPLLHHLRDRLGT